MTLEQFLGAAFVWVTLGAGLGSLAAALALKAFLEGRWDGPGGTVSVAVVFTAFVVAWGVLGVPASRLWQRRGSLTRVGISVALLAGLAAGVSSWGWLVDVPEEPVFLEAGGRFAFGAYPTREVVSSLEEQDFSGVISFLDPEGDPEQAGLVDKERSMTAESGLELFSAPLFAGDSVNRETLDAVRAIVEEGEGRYYVHASGEESLQSSRLLLMRLSGRGALLPDRLAEVEAFERGRIYRLSEGVYLAPFPTESEHFRYYLTGSVRSVLSLMDPETPADIPWIERQRELLEPNGIEFHLAPLPGEPFDPARAVAAAEIAGSLPRPLVVQSFLTASTSAEAFAQAFLAGVPPMPPRLFDLPLRGGSARVVAPNVAVGPRPIGAEFRALYNRGVRAITHVGAPPAGLDRDRDLSREAGLRWHGRVENDSSLLVLVERGGPWYVYGGGSGAIAERIRERYGPALPEVLSEPDEVDGASREPEERDDSRRRSIGG